MSTFGRTPAETPILSSRLTARGNTVGTGLKGRPFDSRISTTDSKYSPRTFNNSYYDNAKSPRLMAGFRKYHAAKVANESLKKKGVSQIISKLPMAKK